MYVRKAIVSLDKSPTSWQVIVRENSVSVGSMHLQSIFTQTKKMRREREQLGETKIGEKMPLLPYSLKGSIFPVSKPFSILSGIEKHSKTATVKRL